jgi:hypothetical protein
MRPSNPGDDAPPAPEIAPPQGWNAVTVNAWGNVDSTQIAGRDVNNIRKRNIRIGLAGLAAFVLLGGSTVAIVNPFGDDGSSIVYEEGLTAEDVERVGSADGEKGAGQTALIYLQAALAGDAATACGLVGDDARAKRFVLRGCEAVVTDYAERMEETRSPASLRRVRDALSKAQTTVRMRGTATAQVIVRPQGFQPVDVITARENDRWRVIGSSIRGLGLD